jgi:membrane protease YdiL (CAAX protease family)
MQPESKNTSVPWTGYDVLLFLVPWLAPLLMSGVYACAACCTVALTQPPEKAAVIDTSDHGHPIRQLVEQGKESPMVFLVAFLSAVVVAPLVEEFLFRLLLQGWLEAKLFRLHVSNAIGIAIVAVSCLFAAIHAGNHSAANVLSLVFGFVASMVFNLFIFTSGIFYLTQTRNVKMIPCLFGTERFFRPRFFLYAGCCLLALIVLFVLNALLVSIYPKTNISPIPIFFFSMLLGTIYSKTRNLSYCILLHALLNGASLILVWLK